MINKKNHRRSIRLKGYDYSQNGLYFITMCIHQNSNLLGNVVDGKMLLNCIGNMIEKQWLDLSEHFEGIKVGEYVLMPNHFHGIIELLGGAFRASRRDWERATTRDCPYGGRCGGSF